MIARVYGEQVSLWTPDSEAALKQCGQFAAYGADRDFLLFYGDDNGNRLSVMDGSATLYAPSDPDEMLLFLTMDPTIKTVRTDRKTAEQLAQLWGTTFDFEAVMKAPKAEVCLGCGVYDDLRQTYEVLLEGFGKEALPPFDVWYADVHHRRRHRLCITVGVAVDHKIVATAMTVAQCETAAHIGAVTTRAEARGKGFASACVLTLSALLQEEGKAVYLSPKNAYAHALYERIGFETVGEWGTVCKPR